MARRPLLRLGRRIRPDAQTPEAQPLIAATAVPDSEAPTANPQGEIEMDVIPFNVPGLPEPDILTGEFVIRPISVDASNVHTGPMFGLHSAASSGSVTGLDDGVLCIYPDTDMISYLFNIQVRSGQKDLLPGVLIHSASVAGSCTLFSLSYDIHNNPVLIVTILPDEYLLKILTTHDGTTIADVSGIEDRLEFTQVFTANSCGAIKRLSNDLTHVPKEQGNAIFDLQKDLDIISDVCSFYMTRTLALSGGEPGASSKETSAAAVGFPWGLLWKPTPWKCIAGFSIVYMLTQTSIRYRDTTGNFRIDYNRNANRRPRSLEQQ